MYGEIIVGVNMLFNYAILSFANKVGNVHAARGRLLFASFTGALPVVTLPLIDHRCHLIFFCMTLYAFGKTFEPWKKSASMVLIGAVFAGGLLTAFQFRISTSNVVDEHSCLCGCCIRLSLLHEEEMARCQNSTPCFGSEIVVYAVSMGCRNSDRCLR